MEIGYEVVTSKGVINMVFANECEVIDGDYYFFNREINGNKSIVASYQKDEVKEINMKSNMKEYMDSIYKEHHD